MNNPKIDPTALFKLGYGLYVVTCHDGKKDNGLIVNTVMQVTNNPDRIVVAINKQNYSHDVIKASGIMNVNCLTEAAPFAVFEAFGFKSGRDTDKFAGCAPEKSENGLVVLPRHINAFLSALPATERHIFICRYWYFDSIGSISRQFGFRETKVKSMLFRTRTKLRDKLKKEGVLIEY